jgi:TolB-like protein
MSFLGELQRRNVVRIGVAYVVTSWLVLQIADTLLDALGTPDWVMPALLGLLALGFLPALAFAWAFEMTPEGLKRESEVDRNTSITHQTAHKLDITIIAMLVVLGGFMVWQSQADKPAATETARVDSAPAAPGKSLPTPSTSQASAGDFDERSIAVLPFVNLSSDPEQEFFSDGISEELLNVLAQVPELRVAARTSSFQFKGDNRDISEIAELLKVNHVLEGSVRKAGTKLRITAQLIEAENGYHLWSETYDRELTDVFAIQDEISAAIGEALKAQMGIQDARALQAPRVAETANTAAYEAYLKGRYLVNQRGNKAIAEAVRELEKSIRLDPNFAPSQAMLSIAITLSNDSASSYGDLTVAEVNQRATPHLERAMELNPGLAETWGAKAILAGTNGDQRAAIEHARKALSINPVYTDALNWLQTSALFVSEYEIADEAVKKLIEVDPLSVVGRINYYSNHLAELDPEAAKAGARLLAEQHAWAGYSTLARIAIVEGDLTGALYWSLRAYAVDPLDRWSNQFMVGRFCDVGMVEEARRVSDVTLLQAEAFCGDLDKAIAMLKRQMQVDPDNDFIGRFVPLMQYWKGDKAEALAGWQEIAEGLGDMPMIAGGYGLDLHLRFAWLLQQSGNPQAADRELAKIDRDLAARGDTATSRYSNIIWDRGMRAFLAGDRDQALDYFEQAVDDHNYDSDAFDDPMLAPLEGNERFEALRTRVDDVLAVEREKMLKLICLDNPVPDSWQPLAETCAEVTTLASQGP